MRCRFQEIRLGFDSRERVVFRHKGSIPAGSHLLTAIYYLYSKPRGFWSRQRVTHEIIIFCTVTGFTVSRLVTPDIILNSV